jgi:hypothetical protein
MKIEVRKEHAWSNLAQEDYIFIISISESVKEHSVKRIKQTWFKRSVH